jgi:hypothetical protein
MNTTTDIRLFTDEEVRGFLCEGCRMNLPARDWNGVRVHSFLGTETPCAASHWTAKPQVQVRLAEKRAAVAMNLQSKVDGALSCIPHGWCSIEKAQVLAATVFALRPETVVEIGVYAGRSFIPMALALQRLGRGRAIGIDPYDAQVSAAGEEESNREWWGSFDHGVIEDFCLTCVRALDLDGFVTMEKRRSDEVPPPENVGLLHVDGAHTEQAIRDVKRFAHNVMIGGVVCLDDILWSSGAVSEAAEVLRLMGFEELYRVIGPEEGTRFYNNWAMFQRMDFAAPGE